MGEPLAGVRMVELAGLGPGPHAGMMLADLGAEIVRVVRPGTPQRLVASAHTLRGRRSVEANLKDPRDLSVVSGLIDRSDVLLEGFRPGVLERLGLGPAECRRRNPRLIYARMTGWGQYGLLSTTAGHDINYLAITGALHAIGTREQPVAPLNLVGDFGGGSMMLMTGVLAALFERERTGVGTVVDAAIVDGVSVLVQGVLELRDAGLWSDVRGENLLDGAAPYYRVYSCSDGQFVAVGAIEPQFYDLLVRGLGFEVDELADRDDRANWAELSARFEQRFADHDREHWTQVFESTDACVSPVLTFAEAAQHPHIVARSSLVVGEMPGSVLATRAPRLGGVRQCEADAAPAGRTTRASITDVATLWT